MKTSDSITANLSSSAHPSQFSGGNISGGIFEETDPSRRTALSTPAAKAGWERWLAVPLAMLVGCASQPPPSAAVREKLGTVAVQAVQATPVSNLVVPATPGQSAVSGAWNGMWEIGSGLGPGRSNAAIGIALMPVGAIVGAVAGSRTGTPKKESEAAAERLRKAFAESDFQETVRREVEAAIRKVTSHPVARAGQTGPGNLPRADSLLEVNVLEANLEGSSEKNAWLALALKVRVRLLSLPDGIVLYEDTWSERCGFLTFNEWGEPGASAFERELVGASRAMAADIVNHLFLGQPSTKKLLWATPPKPGNRAAPKRGQVVRGSNSGISSERYHGWESQW